MAKNWPLALEKEETTMKSHYGHRRQVMAAVGIVAIAGKKGVLPMRETETARPPHARRSETENPSEEKASATVVVVAGKGVNTDNAKFIDTVAPISGKTGT
jgi:hypothetical protein